MIGSATVDWIVSNSKENWNYELDADLLTLDVEKTSLGFIPEDFVSLFYLKNKGDFCLSNTSSQAIRFSIKADNESVHHLIIDEHEGGVFKCRGLVHGEGSSVGELLYVLRDPTIDFLSGIFECPIVFRQLVTQRSVEDRRILQKSQIFDYKIVHKDANYKYFKAKANIGNEMKDVCMKQSHINSLNEWNSYMFEQIRISIVSEHLKLPMHAPLAVYLEDAGYLVYEDIKGMTLSKFITANASTMDFINRIQLCNIITCIMSELHMAEMFHGNLKSDNFFMKINPQSPQKVKVLFNGCDGLVHYNCPKESGRMDYTEAAPEVSWTRQLTPQSGVYSLGVLFKLILEHPPSGTTDKSLFNIVCDMNELVSKCMKAKPLERPTMDGIFLHLNKIGTNIKKPSTSSWNFY